MKKNIPWILIVDYLTNRINETDNQLLQDWRSEAVNESLLSEVKNLWDTICKRGSVYNPDKKRNWQILTERLHLNEEYKESINNRLLYRYATIAAIFVFIALLGTFYAGKQSGMEKPKELVYSTYRGKSKVILPDGTEVWLHDNTTLKCPSRFSKDMRKVILSGEAYFNVVKNQKTPFIVLTEELETHVFGTQFNILAYSKSEEIRVSLTEGAISVKSGLNEKTMNVGDEAIYNKKTKEIKLIPNADNQQTSIWIKDRIHFEKQTLKQIVPSLSKWYGIEIKIDSTLAEKYTYTFTLRNEPLEEILRLMGEINPIEYEFNENNKLFITEKEPKSNLLKQYAYEINNE